MPEWKDYLLTFGTCAAIFFVALALMEGFSSALAIVWDFKIILLPFVLVGALWVAVWLLRWTTVVICGAVYLCTIALLRVVAILGAAWRGEKVP